MTISTWLQLLTGGGLIGAALKAGAIFRDVSALVRDTNALLNAHLANHPGPGPEAPQPPAPYTAGSTSGSA